MLSAEIYSRFAPAPKSVADYDQEAYAADNARQTNALQALTLAGRQREEQDARRASTERNALRDMVSRFGADEGANTQALLRGGYLKEAQDYREATAKRRKDAADTAHKDAQADRERLAAGLQHFETMGQLMGGVRDQTTYEFARQRAAEIFGPEFAAKIPPQYDPQQIAQARLQAMSVQQRLEQEWKARGYDLQAGQHAETARHNRAGEATAAGNLAVSRQRLAHERAAPRGQIVQSDQGTVLVDPRTGQSMPVVGPDGAPLGPKLKDIPAPMQKAMLENASNVRRAEQALALVQGEDVGEMKGDKAATGWKGFLPNQALNRIDPAGVDARAAIADLGSLVIHDRSGAAVTAAEFPRLAPFIPTEKDDAATAEKKLKRFLQVYREEMGAMQSAYGPDTGYRASPAASGPSAGAGKKPGVVDFGSLR